MSMSTIRTQFAITANFSFACAMSSTDGSVWAISKAPRTARTRSIHPASRHFSPSSSCTIHSPPSAKGTVTSSTSTSVSRRALRYCPMAASIDSSMAREIEG